MIRRMRWLTIALRFALVVILFAGAIGLVGRALSDFDNPPEQDPNDVIRGIGVRTAAVLVAILVELRLNRLRALKKRD